MYSYIVGDFIGSLFEDLGTKGDENALLINEKLAHTYTDDTALALGICYWLLTPGAIEHLQTPEAKLQEFTLDHLENRFDSHLIQYFRWPNIFKKEKFSVAVLASIAVPIALWTHTDEEREHLLNLASSPLTSHEPSRHLLSTVAWLVHHAFNEQNPESLRSQYLERHPETNFIFEMPWEELQKQHQFSIELKNLIPVCVRVVTENSDYETCLQKLFSLGGIASSEGALTSVLWEGLHGDIPENMAKKVLTHEIFRYDYRLLSLLNGFINHEKLKPLYEKRKLIPPDLKSWINEKFQ